MKRSLELTLFAGILLAAGCADMEDLAHEDEALDEEDTSEIEQGVYSAWYDLSGPYGSAIVRACKTSTRINWQFAYNTYTTAATQGDGISYIQSSVAGQSTGTKYRTRSGTTFSISFGTNGHWKGVGYNISQLPNC